MIWEYEVYYLKVSILTPVKTSQTNSDTLHKFPFEYLEKNRTMILSLYIRK